MGEQPRRCPARRRVGDELHGPLPERRPLGVAVQNGLHDLGEPQLGRFNRMRDRFVWSGVGELPVCGVQIENASRQAVFTRIG